MKFALIKELKTAAEARVLFSPKQLADIIIKYPACEFVVQSSKTRVFSDKEYRDLGIPVVNNVSDADILFGIKEVPLEALIPKKTYFFFSHTTKMQPHNKAYLKGLKESKITFYDYENFTDKNGQRLISFGKNAGQIGAYQSIRAYGLKNNLFALPSPSKLNDFQEFYTCLKKIDFPPIKIVVTGTGNVGKGINEFLTLMGIQQISSNDFLNKEYKGAVFTQLSKKDYLIHKKTKKYIKSDFINNPDNYESTFFKFAQQAALFITGHYHHKGMPLFFTKKQVSDPSFNINTIGDISCDPFGPLPTCLRPSTPSDPIYGYHKLSGKESNYINNDSIAVMAVDNLPCQLPRITSIDFGNQFIEHLLDLIISDIDNPLIKKACLLKGNNFTKPYSYLVNFLLKTE